MGVMGKRLRVGLGYVVSGCDSNGVGRVGTLGRVDTQDMVW